MTTRTITDPADWRAGDTATIEYEGHAATGEVWENGPGSLLVGTTTIRFPDGRTPATVTTTVTREVPDLPTETGSVIFVTEVRGVREDIPVVAALDTDGDWVTARRFGGHQWHNPEHITDWAPAKVVPA